MEYSAEDAYMMNDKESMNPVHHIVDDTSEDDPHWDDERADDNAKVVTWFTFYSHRAQREYYYEPISGTTTWIAPSQTTTEAAEEEDECVISRLPGSPLETVQEDATRLYEKRVIPVITRRPVALFLFLSNMVLFAALWQSFRHGITLPEVANSWIREAQSAVSVVMPSNIAMKVTSIMDDASSGEEDSVSNFPMESDTSEMFQPDDIGVASDTPPEDATWAVPSEASDDTEDKAEELLLVVPDDTAEDDATKEIPPIENDDRAESGMMEDALLGVLDDALVEEKDAIPDAVSRVDDVIHTSSFAEVLEDEPEGAMETVDITIDAVSVETDIVPPSVDEDGVVVEDDDIHTKSSPLETVDVLEEEKDETEAPVDTVDSPESSIEEEVVSSEDADDATVVDAVEKDLEETLHRIQKEGDLLVQRVALVATKRGFSIELEPNLTAGFTHAPLELLLQEGGVV